jgi:muramoyltetrapeptide carboxypeptidase
LAEFSKNPKWFIGYSDNTVFQSYLLKKGFASIHAQTIKTSGFGVSSESFEQTFDILKGKLKNYLDFRPDHFTDEPQRNFYL